MYSITKYEIKGYFWLKGEGKLAKLTFGKLKTWYWPKVYCNWNTKKAGSGLNLAGCAVQT